MKAMIFAAGLGTRLKPLTDNIPKALITLNNTPLLEILIKKLQSYDINDMIINTHHHADKIAEFLKKNEYFGSDIKISLEKDLLDTGGGLKKASWFFKDEQYFLVHNVDIISDINITDMINHHIENNAVATLAVRKRETSRQLLFNRDMKLCGWKNRKTNEVIIPDKNIAESSEYAFSGIHIISSDLFSYFPDKDFFSIIETYLIASKNGAFIAGWVPKCNFWMDLGKPDQLQKAAHLLSQIND